MKDEDIHDDLQVSESEEEGEIREEDADVDMDASSSRAPLNSTRDEDDDWGFWKSLNSNCVIFFLQSFSKATVNKYWFFKRIELLQLFYSEWWAEQNEFKRLNSVEKKRRKMKSLILFDNIW